MIISATSLRSVGSGSASARWALRVVVSVAARIEPSTANPTVEPSARCALMMPDAIPARSAGTVVIASDVIGVRHNPAPMPTKTRPATTTRILTCSPAVRTANPQICARMRTFNHGKRESPDRRHEQKLPGDVERAWAFVPRLRYKAPRQGHGDEPDGNVDHEDRAPARHLHH